MRVVKLAQPGYDVQTAGDENLIYSSQWPLLSIYKQDSFTISDIKVDAVITDHDLGFVPVFYYFANTTVASYDNLTIATDQRSEFFGPVGDGSIKITDKQLVWDSNSSPFTLGKSKLYYYLFALDLTKQFTAPTIKVGDVRGGSGTRVFKLAKPGKDVNSTNIVDFIIHSKARSPLIHSVNPGVVTNRSFAVYHDLGYRPMFFGYTRNADGSYSMLATGTGGATKFAADEQKVEFTEASSTRTMTIVILKDPFVIDATRSVVI